MDIAFPAIHDKKARNVITMGLGVHQSFGDISIVG